ncbi:MAG: MlaD family protein [Candidatus Omnitrophota bacterium]
MIRNKKLEIKVGLFIGMGMFLMFLIVFSISDIYLLKNGYNVSSEFDFVNGITENAPVRLAGVNVGEIKKTEIFYDDKQGKTRVRLDIWVNESVRLEKDAIARINTLGLLGEQYLEITPGSSKEFLSPGETLEGKTPVNIGEQMEGVNDIIRSFKSIAEKAEKGEGTLGKFLSDDSLYNKMESILDKIDKGKGTIGQLISNDKMYKDLEAFASDIRAHPWKLLSKPSRKRKDKTTDDKKMVEDKKKVEDRR